MPRYVELKILIILGISLASRASIAAPDQYFKEGLQIYFKHHPPKEQMDERNIYPYPGPVFWTDQDMPFCSAADQGKNYSNRSDKLIRGKEGWIFAEGNFKTDLSIARPIERYFQRLNQSLKERGQKLVVFIPPPRGVQAALHMHEKDLPAGYDNSLMWKKYHDLISQFEAIGITSVGIPSIPKDIDFFMKGDTHWTVEGARYAAQFIAQRIKRLPTYQNLQKKDFQTEIIGYRRPSLGVYQKRLQDICQVNIGLQSLPQWSTTVQQRQQQLADNELFEDSVFPKIVVLGTSFTAEDENYDFIGALKRRLHVDIYNAALVGGGFASSTYRYFSSDEYRMSPPQIILWEFLPHHEYSNEKSVSDFRQILPSLSGPCKEENTIAKEDRTLNSREIRIFKETNVKDLSGTYIYLKLTHPVERNINLQILYKDGRADDVDLTRSTRASNNGEYYFEIEEDKEKSAHFFEILTDQPKGNLHARLCSYSSLKSGN